METQVYIIKQNPGEKFIEFTTRLANEIQILECKILEMNIHFVGHDNYVTITYQNLK